MGCVRTLKGPVDGGGPSVRFGGGGFAVLGSLSVGSGFQGLGAELRAERHEGAQGEPTPVVFWLIESIPQARSS